MEDVEHDRNLQRIGRGQSLLDGVAFLVVFEYESPEDGFRQLSRTLDESRQACGLGAERLPPQVEDDFGAVVGTQHVEDPCVILQFGNAVLDNLVAGRIDHGELARVHRHPHAVCLDGLRHVMQLRLQ